MKRPALVPVLLFVALAATACSRKEDATPAPGAAAAPTAKPAAKAAEDSVAKIPILPGYKYYAGGPGLSRDKYGKYRISSFNGEVQAPPSRGMIFGAKREGDQLEYRVWGNGVLLGLHRGTMIDGVFWEDYAEAYRNGKLVARQRVTHEDDARRDKLVTEDIDPDNGEVIRTKESYVSYLPPAIKVDDDMDDDDDSKPAAAASPAAPAPVPAPGAAPAAPAPQAPNSATK